MGIKLIATLAVAGLLAACTTALAPPPKRYNMPVPVSCQTVLPPVPGTTPVDTLAPSDSTAMVAKKWTANSYFWMDDDFALRIQIAPCLRDLRKEFQTEGLPQPAPKTPPRL